MKNKTYTVIITTTSSTSEDTESSSIQVTAIDREQALDKIHLIIPTDFFNADDRLLYNQKVTFELKQI